MSKKNSAFSRTIKKGLLLALIGLIFGVTCFFTLHVYVSCKELGVKQRSFGIPQLWPRGWVQNVYSGQFVFRVPGIQKVFRTTRHLWVLDYNQRQEKLDDDDLLINLPAASQEEQEQMKKDIRDFLAKQAGHTVEKPIKNYIQMPALNVRLSDQDYGIMDVTCLARVSDAYLAFSKIGPGETYVTEIFKKQVRPIILQTLGRLTVATIADPNVRLEVANKACELLNESFNNKGLEFLIVFERNITLPPEIQVKIEEKTLQLQKTLRQDAESQAQEALAKLKKLEAEGAAAAENKISEADKYVTEKMAEKQKYVDTQHSLGDKEYGIAKAKGEKWINTAYQGPGSIQQLKFAAASSVYKHIGPVVITGLNPLKTAGFVDPNNALRFTDPNTVLNLDKLHLETFSEPAANPTK